MKSYGFALALLLVPLYGALAQDTDLPSLDTLTALVGKERYEQALEGIEQRIAADANDVQALFLKGIVLLRKNERQGAVEAFQKITQLFPQLPEPYNNLSTIYAAQGEYEKAQRALLSAAANAPDYPVVYVNLGDLYVLMAQQAYQRALKLTPSDNYSAIRLELLQNLNQAE